MSLHTLTTIDEVEASMLQLIREDVYKGTALLEDLEPPIQLKEALHSVVSQTGKVHQDKEQLIRTSRNAAAVSDATIEALEGMLEEGQGQFEDGGSLFDFDDGVELRIRQRVVAAVFEQSACGYFTGNAHATRQNIAARVVECISQSQTLG